MTLPELEALVRALADARLVVSARASAAAEMRRREKDSAAQAAEHERVVVGAQEIVDRLEARLRAVANSDVVA
jgi:hypothetical protein